MDTMEDLNCPICLEVLSDPVMLPKCGHSLCRACLLGITTQPPACPICRVKHEGPPLQHLPTNYIVAALARQKSAESAETSTEQQMQVPTGEERPNLTLRKNSFGVLVMDPEPQRKNSVGALLNVPGPSSRISDMAETRKSRPQSTHLPFNYGLVNPGQRPISSQLNDVNSNEDSEKLKDTSEENDVTYRSNNQPTRPNRSCSTQPANTVRVNQRRPISLQNLNNRDMPLTRAVHSTIDEESLSEERVHTPVLPTAPPVSLYADPDVNQSQGEISIALTDPANPEQEVVLSSRSRSLLEELQSNDTIHVDDRVPLQKTNRRRSVRKCWLSFQLCLAGAIMGLIYLYFFTSYSWMILFGIFKKDFNRQFEKEYLITVGICGLPKITHISYRILRGNASCLEKFFFILYYIFDLSLIVVGIFKYIDGNDQTSLSTFNPLKEEEDLELHYLIFANSPFVVIIGFTAIAFILSITSAPLTPQLKASSGFTKFLGYSLFFLTILAFIGIYLIMIILGYRHPSSNDKIYLYIAGVFGIWTIGHGMFYLVGNGNRLCLNIFRIAFLFYILAWLTLGLVTYFQLFPVQSLTFWIINTPVIIIAGLSLLIWSLRVITKIRNNELEDVSATDIIPPHWI